MAVTKTPRKKIQAAPAEEALPAAKKKPAAAKKTAAKKAEAPPAVPEPKPARKPKATKAAVAMEATAAPIAPVAPVAKAPVKRPAPPLEKGLSPFAAAILDAIQEGRALEFLFTDTDAYAPRTFEPRQLTYDALSQAWYVWGWDRRYNAERFHRLDLLSEVNAVEGVGRSAQGPYAEDTPANQIGGWLGGEPIQVKATLLKQWVFAVKQAPPAFPNFRMEELNEGQALVSFTATDLRAIARWAMQFGDGIQVQEPARLLDRIKQVAAVWTGRDRQQTGPAPASKPSSMPEPAAEPRRSESRHHRDREPRPEREARPEREPRPEREAKPEREARPPRESEREEAPQKSKPGKIEVIRFDRL